jgi:trans-2,3-dihydro-3-hydroxyanthranilate isomerase
MMTPQAAPMKLTTLPFSLVDVFAREPLSGNGLSVFLLDQALPTSAMQRITQEMRQFETIFLHRIGESARFNTRIFTMEEELAFAGHPIIGAAALLHAMRFAADPVARFEFVTVERTIAATSRRKGATFSAEMDQGIVIVGAPLARARNEVLLQALNLSASDLAPNLPLQVLSTGLPYLIVPVNKNLERARIVAGSFETLLASAEAKFVYVFDVGRREGRTWDNDGRVEDIATGSAAGPAAAYLVAHGLAKPGENLVINQGRFLDRPSELHAIVRGDPVWSVTVRGQVCFVGSGTLQLPDEALREAKAIRP